ncbi:MAG: type II toxin-antitoxin system RelE/ParE family toxin, partial [bacterium]
MVRKKEYLDESGNSPFAKWFDRLDTQAALKVNTYITRIETGNFSQVKSVGSGVYECRIDWGPGYR